MGEVATKRASDFFNRQVDSLVEKNMGALQQDLSNFLQNRLAPAAGGRNMAFIPVPNVGKPSSPEQLDAVRVQLERTRAAVNDYLSMWRSSAEGRGKSVGIDVQVQWSDTDRQYAIVLERTSPTALSEIRLRKTAIKGATAATAAGMDYATSGSIMSSISRTAVDGGQQATGTGTVNFIGEAPYAAQFDVRDDTRESARLAFTTALHDMLSFYGFPDAPSDLAGLGAFLKENKDARDALKIARLSVNGSASLEIAKIPDKDGKLQNQAKYDRQVRDNQKVADKRANAGADVAREFFAEIYGEGKGPVIEKAGSIVNDAFQSDTNKSINYLMSCGIVREGNEAEFDAYAKFIRYNEKTMGAIGEGDTTGMLIARRFLSDGMIVQGTDGKYSISSDTSKRKDLNSLILQTALGGLRNEDNANDPLRQMFERCDGGRAITFGIGGAQSVQISLTSPAAVRAGEQMSVPVAITRTRPDGSTFTVEHPQESIDFRNVSVTGPDGKKVDYKYEEADNSVKFTASMPGKYSVTAIGITLDTAHKQLLDTKPTYAIGEANIPPAPVVNLPAMLQLPAPFVATVRTRQKVDIASVIFAFAQGGASQYYSYFVPGTDTGDRWWQALDAGNPGTAADILSQNYEFFRQWNDAGVFRQGKNIDDLISFLRDNTALFRSNPQEWVNRFYQIVDPNSEFSRTFNLTSQNISTSSPEFLSKISAQINTAGFGITIMPHARRLLAEQGPGAFYQLTLVAQRRQTTNVKAYLNVAGEPSVNLPSSVATDIAAVVTFVAPLETLLSLGASTTFQQTADKSQPRDAAYWADLEKTVRIGPELFASFNAGATWKGKYDDATRTLVSDPGFRGRGGVEVSKRWGTREVKNKYGQTVDYDVGKWLTGARIGYDFLQQEGSFYDPKLTASVIVGYQPNDRIKVELEGGASDINNKYVKTKLTYTIPGKKGKTIAEDKPEVQIFGFGGVTQVQQEVK